MAFPVTNTATERLYIAAKTTLASARNQAQSLNSASLSGPVSASAILQLIDSLRACKNAIATAEAAPNIGQVAKDYEQDQTLDLATEWTVVSNAVNTLLTWMATNLPQSGGYLQIESIDANGIRTVREFSTAALADLRANLTAFINTMT